MAKTLISYPPFIGSVTARPVPNELSSNYPNYSHKYSYSNTLNLLSLSSHIFHPLRHRKLISTRVNFSFNEIPRIQPFSSSINFNSIIVRAEDLLYTRSEAAVSADSAAAGGASASADTTVMKNGGWFGLIADVMEIVLKGLLTEGFFWIPSLAGPTTIAARQSGSGISWLIPFVDGHPPLGGHATAAYLVLPALLVVSQYVSMELMKPPQTDDQAQKNTLLIFKFLPLMIGYFSLSVPSGLSIYWFANNVLSMAQQGWLRKL